MFIRARLLHGARKLRVNPAGGIPSRRRVIEDPWLQYATAGFPREASWVRTAAQHPSEQRDVDAFAEAVLMGREPEAVRLRRAHQLALFRYLPALVAEALNTRRRADQPLDTAAALAAMPIDTEQDLAIRPGTALTALLRLVDTRPDLFGKS